MKLSLITPIYNTPTEYLKAYFETLLAQRQQLSNVEILIVNDGGADPELNFNNYQLNIKYLSYGENKGPGYARQYGVDHADGDYVIFCDSDDRFTENAFQLYNDAVKQETDVFYPNSMIFRDEFTDNRFPDNIHGLCIKKSFLVNHNIRFLNQKFHEDGFYTLNIQMRNPKVMPITGATIIHNSRCNSLSYFTNTNLYSLSLFLSTAQILQQFVPDHYLNEKMVDTIEVQSFFGRFESAINDFNQNKYNDNYRTFATIICSMLWNYLPGSCQDNYSEHFTLMSRDKLNNDLFNWCRQFIIEETNVDGQNIQAYLLSCFEDMIKLYNATLDISGPIKCTIVCPTYNNSKDEWRCLLNSFNTQTCAPWLKLLIINDGSSDWVGDKFILDRVANIQTEILHLPHNHGVGYARRYGMSRVNTEYFMIMDADDCISNPDVLYHFINWLDHHPEDFGVRGWERCGVFEPGCTEPSGTAIHQYEFYEGNSLHGLCGRTQSLRENNITFKPLQYVEDGLFVDELRCSNLKVTTLPFVFYERLNGHLTKNVESAIGNLNNLNDLYNLIRFKAYKYKNECRVRNNADLCVLLTSLENIDQENSSYYYIQEQQHPDAEIRWFLKTYYRLVILKELTPEQLSFFVDFEEYPIQQCVNLQAFILALLHNFNCKFYNPFSQTMITQEEIELVAKNYIIARAAELSADGGYIPHQLMKNFPWCYKAYQWRE